MSADLKSLFPATPALRSVLRPEDLAAETFARHLPWLSAPADNLILTRQGDLIASAVVEGQDSFTTEEGDLSLATTSLARLIVNRRAKLTPYRRPKLTPLVVSRSGPEPTELITEWRRVRP